MNKADLTRTIEDAHPELPAGLHLPRLAVVTAIPDPPKAEGTVSHHPAPKYAVSIRLLTPQLETDPDIPELRDVPVCLPGAGGARGIAALPQPGTVVEVAFAYGQLHLPFIRSALPYELELPTIDADHIRIQHTADTWQQADANGWQRITTGTISDQADGDINAEAGGDINAEADGDINAEADGDINHTAGAGINQAATAHLSATAPQVWLGSDTLNVLQALSDHLQTIVDMLIATGSHTHPGTSSSPTKDTWLSQATATLALKAQLDAITKPTP